MGHVFSLSVQALRFNVSVWKCVWPNAISGEVYHFAVFTCSLCFNVFVVNGISVLTDNIHSGHSIFIQYSFKPGGLTNYCPSVLDTVGWVI